MEKSIVYFTKNITPENLIKIYEKLGVNYIDEEIISTSK